MKKYLIPSLGVLFGAIAGFLYWKLVGCSTGTCPITSKPLNSTLYGGVMGYLLVSIVVDLVKKD